MRHVAEEANPCRIDRPLPGQFGLELGDAFIGLGGSQPGAQECPGVRPPLPSR
jgi:hypothetical protein